MVEKADVCGVDCCKSATPAGNNLSVPLVYPQFALSMWPGGRHPALGWHANWGMSAQTGSWAITLSVAEAG